MPWRKVSSIDQTSSEKIMQTMDEIDKVKKKISVKERSQDVAGELNFAAEKRNEEIIHALRIEIYDLREELSNDLRKEVNLFYSVFSNIPRRSLLALKNKRSLKDISYEVTQQLCECKRKYNKLVFIKNENLKKLAHLEKLKGSVKVKKEKETFPRSTKLENAIDLVKQKSASAKKIYTIYAAVRKQLEKQVLSYPKLLDDLEAEKARLNDEDIYMRYLNVNAENEMEIVMRDKKTVEERSRQSRKNRDAVMKRLESKVAAFHESSYDSQNIKKINQNLKKKKRTIIEQEATEAVKTEEEKINFDDILNEYEDQANLLKSITGIPFWNVYRMTSCLKNQMNKAKSLKHDSHKKFKKLQSLQKQKEVVSAELDKIKYTNNNDLCEQIQQISDLITEKKNWITKLKRRLENQHKTVDKVLLCSDVILNYLSKSKVLYKLSEESEEDIEQEESGEAEKCTTRLIARRFNIITSSLESLNEEKERKMSFDDYEEAELLDLAATQEEHDRQHPNRYPQTNIRIPGIIDRKTSEYEFDHSYNTPNNDQYLTREAVKRRTLVSIRASRARR